MYSKILITGGNGFLGRHVIEKCKMEYPEATLLTPTSTELDLRERKETLRYFKNHQPDAVISIAARLGGIGDNREYPATYFYDNITIGINTIEGARLNGVRKIVNIGTVCSYPKHVEAPFKEEDLWSGYPEPTNGPYGIAKKAVGEYALAVEKQYGLSCVNLLVTNLYGPGDDFRAKTSHVIPALIKKIIFAQEENTPEIVAWGDGSPTRDFLYVTDAADGIVKALECDEHGPINLGAGEEISIKQLFEKLADKIGFNGKVKWDTSKPNGQPRRLLDISKAEELLNFKPATSFDVGLEQMISWYLTNRNEIDALPPKFMKS